MLSLAPWFGGGWEPRHPLGVESTRWCPWLDSNQRSRLRRPVLYPLSYRGIAAPSYLTGIRTPS